jgi:hypothetical protein
MGIRRPLVDRCLPETQWAAQVLAVREQQIKGVVARLTSAKQQVSELRSARLIQANDFPIEHGIQDAALQGKSKVRVGKGFELVPVAGYQSAMAILEVCQTAKGVPLNLKEPVRMGKRPWRTANWHGLKLRQHLSNIIRDFPCRAYRDTPPTDYSGVREWEYNRGAFEFKKRTWQFIPMKG